MKYYYWKPQNYIKREYSNKIIINYKQTENVKSSVDANSEIVIKKPTNDVKQSTNDVKQSTNDVKKPTNDVKQPTNNVKQPTNHVNKSTNNPGSTDDTLNKKHILNENLKKRFLVKQTNPNPFFIDSNYIDDLDIQNKFLR
jgi:hypothetical protein